MLDYIIKVLLFQTLFLAVYDLVLKRETFFQWNRAYLLVTSFIAYLIPFIKLDSVQTILPQEYMVQLPEIMLSPTTVIEETFDWSSLFFDSLQGLFFIGMLVFLGLFVFKLYELIRLISTNERLNLENYRLVLLESSKAFSFFNYIFLGKALSEENKQQIITHELVHVRQKHSVDLLLFEVQKIVCWFNPFSYLFQHRISELHEFIADSKAIKSTEKTTYFQNLLTQTFGTHKISFINPFFKISLIKKRIVMLNKHKSKQVLKLKYLLLIPVLLSMLMYSSCEKGQETIVSKEKSIDELVLELESKLAVIESDLKNEEILQLMEKLTEEMNTEDKRKEYIAQYLYAYLLSKKENLLNESKGKDQNLVEDNKIDEVPFGAIINPPVFPGCEDAEDPKKCFTSKMNTYVAENFDISLAKSLGLEAGKKKIYVQFLIDKEGNVVDAKSRAPHETLEVEAIRLVNGLPKMRPGKTKDGKEVTVAYMLPISFRIE